MGALTVPGGRGVGGVRSAAAKLLAVGPELRRASEPLRVDKERELDLLVLPLAEVYELRVLAVRTLHAALLVQHGVGLLTLGDDQRHPRGHADVVLFDVEVLAALAAAVVLPGLHGERL